MIVIVIIVINVVTLYYITFFTFLHGCHTGGDITIIVCRGRHLSNVGQRRHTGGDISSKVGQGRHTGGDVGVASSPHRRHTDDATPTVMTPSRSAEDVTLTVTTSARAAEDATLAVTTSARSAEDATPTVTSPARSAEDATPTVTTSARSAEDATLTVTSLARFTVNPAIFRGIEVGPPTNFESATTSSSAERSSSDIICRTKGGVFLMVILAPAKPVGIWMSTGSWIRSIISADTRRLAFCHFGVSTGDWPIEVPAVQQVPGVAESTYVHQVSSGGLYFMQAS